MSIVTIGIDLAKNVFAEVFNERHERRRRASIFGQRIQDEGVPFLEA